MLQENVRERCHCLIKHLNPRMFYYVLFFFCIHFTSFDLHSCAACSENSGFIHLISRNDNEREWTSVRPHGCLEYSTAMTGCVGVHRVVHGNEKLRIKLLL